MDVKFDVKVDMVVNIYTDGKEISKEDQALLDSLLRESSRETRKLEKVDALTPAT
jgi:hypothetical protein